MLAHCALFLVFECVEAISDDVLGGLRKFDVHGWGGNGCDPAGPSAHVARRTWSLLNVAAALSTNVDFRSPHRVGVVWV